MCVLYGLSTACGQRPQKGDATRRRTLLTARAYQEAEPPATRADFTSFANFNTSFPPFEVGLTAT